MKIEGMSVRNIARGLPVGWFLIGLFAVIALFNLAAHAEIIHTKLRSAVSVDAKVERIDSVGFTVSDMDKAIDFYTGIFGFVKVSDQEIWGDEFERMSGVFGARARVVRLQIGGEILELTEYLTPGGRPVPVDFTQ